MKHKALSSNSSPTKNKFKIFLNTQHKKGLGGVAQAVEHLPSKHEALSLSPSTEKKKFTQGETE
jgi:hypothetical protein